MKRVSENLKLVDREKKYTPDEAIDILICSKSPKFDETIDLAINLGIDPRHAEEAVRGTVALPSGTGKDITVLAIVEGDDVKEALDAGANFAGSDEYFEKINSGWTDVDIIIATPDMMPALGKLGKILGPKKLMPNPKSGTVTKEIGKTVKEMKGGKIEFRVDKYGIIHSSIGKMSFSKEKIYNNLDTLMRAILKARPASLKGVYINKITLSSSMGPGIKIDKNSFRLN